MARNSENNADTNRLPNWKVAYTFVDKNYALRTGALVIPAKDKEDAARIATEKLTLSIPDNRS